MAQSFIFCSVLWIVVAVIAVGQSQLLTTRTPATSTMAPVTTPASVTTAAPTPAPSNTTATGTTVSPTPAPDPCDKNPCGRGSTCETRADQTFMCLCLPGDYYNNISNRCDSAKVFPGQLELPEIVYENSMSDKASPAFKRAADIITEELFNSLGSDDTYSGCIVLELRSVSNTRLRVNQHVNASVELIYSAESTVTTSQVQQMVKTATECTDCALAGATFADVNLCERNPCDAVTTRCSPLEGTFNCTCLADYVPSDHSTRMCLACPSGHGAENSVCVMCPFGYSGFNCKDTWQLTLVIVGSVLGGLLLILLTIVSVWCLKKSSKKNKASDIGLIPAKGPVANKRPDNRNSQREDNHYDEISPYAVYEPTPK